MLALLGWIALGNCSQSHAADYQVDPVDPQAKRHSGLVLSVIRNPARYAGEKTKVQEYFTGYYFPAMTQVGNDDLAVLGNLRFDLFRKYLWATDNEALQRDVTELAFNAARKIVGASNPPYHPAVRYNAMLILGQLDQQYAIEGANPRPPVPLPAATELLIKVVSAAADDKAVPPPVTLGAIIGLERHARAKDSLQPGAVDAMTASLLKLINRDKPTADMDRDTFDWLRLRSAGVLAQLGSFGTKNEVHAALVKLIADLRSLDDRIAAAALLSRFTMEGAKLDEKSTVEPLVALTRDVGTAELKRAVDFQEMSRGGGGYGPARGEMYMTSGAGTRENFPRRHVLGRLSDLRIALRAVKPAVGDEAKARIDGLIKLIDPAIKAAEDKNMGELNLAAAIRTMGSAIESQTQPAGQTEAAEPEDVF